MIHSGSRGLGHQVATGNQEIVKFDSPFFSFILKKKDFLEDSLVAMEKTMAADNIVVNDRQLACARISSEEGQNYLAAMAAAANFAWVNRASMTYLCRQVN